jgi:hypothetical protein
VILFHWLQSLYWPETGKGYALGSSWAGDTGIFAAFSMTYILWKRHNCHKPGCPRISNHIHVVDGHHDQYCRKHKPEREAS